MDYISIACWTSPSHGPSRGFIPWGLIPLAFVERFSTLEQIRCAGSQWWVRRPWKEQDRDGRFHHSIIPSAQMEEFVSGGIMCILYIYIHIAVSVSVSWGVQLLKNTHTVPDPGWNWVQLWLVHTIGKPVSNIIAGHFTSSQTGDIPNFMSLHWERFIIGFTTWLFLILNYLSKCQQQHFVAVLHVFLN